MTLDARRKRLLFRAAHRGTKEADFVVGGFATARLEDMTDGQLDAFEALLDVDDDLLMLWCTGRAPAPAQHDADLVASIYRHALEKNSF
jgi:antitoxin CptB